MSSRLEQKKRFHNVFLIVFAIGISLLFLHMISDFVMALLLAAIVAGLLHSSYVRLARKLGGRRYTSAVLILALVVLLVVGPLSGLFAIVVSQAAQLSRAVTPWINQQLSDPAEIEAWLENLPFAEYAKPYRDEIVTKVGEWAGLLANEIANLAGAATTGTARALISLFVMLYAVFFFLIDGRGSLEKLLYYIPLSAADEEMMLDRFLSVTRATLKGTLVIGVVQGALAGVAFAIAGIEGSLFWGTLMAVLSIIPGVGIALVWVPAAIYLGLTDQVAAAIGLALWCGLIAGMVDNVLRPRLVGQDTQMSDLLILVSTLGGLTLFGAVGIIVGPIIAALSVTVWELYGRTFASILPAVGLAPENIDTPPKSGERRSTEHEHEHEHVDDASDRSSSELERGQ